MNRQMAAKTMVLPDGRGVPAGIVDAAERVAEWMRSHGVTEFAGVCLSAELERTRAGLRAIGNLDVVPRASYDAIQHELMFIKANKFTR